MILAAGSHVKDQIIFWCYEDSKPDRVCSEIEVEEHIMGYVMDLMSQKQT
jgi:hypothetical protein